VKSHKMIVESSYIAWLPLIYFHMVHQRFLFRDFVSVAFPSPQRMKFVSPRNTWSGAVIFTFPVIARTLSECIGQTLECAKQLQVSWNDQVPMTFRRSLRLTCELKAATNIESVLWLIGNLASGSWCQGVAQNSLWITHLCSSHIWRKWPTKDI
jgi:hypothetical protein